MISHLNYRSIHTDDSWTSSPRRSTGEFLVVKKEAGIVFWGIFGGILVKLVRRVHKTHRLCSGSNLSFVFHWKYFELESLRCINLTKASLLNPFVEPVLPILYFSIFWKITARVTYITNIWWTEPTGYWEVCLRFVWIRFGVWLNRGFG